MAGGGGCWAKSQPEKDRARANRFQLPPTDVRQTSLSTTDHKVGDSANAYLYNPFSSSGRLGSGKESRLQTDLQHKKKQKQQKRERARH